MEKRKAYRILKEIYLEKFGEELHWIIGKGESTIGVGSIMLFDHGFKNNLNFVCVNINGKQLGIINPEFTDTDIMNLLKVDALREI